jgi:hypothetical protein
VPLEEQGRLTIAHPQEQGSLTMAVKCTLRSRVACPWWESAPTRAGSLDHSGEVHRQEQGHLTMAVKCTLRSKVA